MNAKDEFIKIAKRKARKDYQKHPKSFLRGVTNQYSKHVDTYMRQAYQDERMTIIKELRHDPDSKKT